MSCNFHVGQKVVCVDDENQSSDNGKKDVYVGKVYTVSWSGIFIHPFYGKAEEVVRLSEVSRWCPASGVDMPLRANRFRPVVARKTDISIFKAMLNPSKQRAEV